MELIKSVSIHCVRDIILDPTNCVQLQQHCNRNAVKEQGNYNALQINWFLISINSSIAISIIYVKGYLCILNHNSAQLFDPGMYFHGSCIFCNKEISRHKCKLPLHKCLQGKCGYWFIWGLNPWLSSYWSPALPLSTNTPYWLHCTCSMLI